MTPDSERGSVTVFVSLAAIGLFLAAGLIVTGGDKVIALNQASQVANAAARAGTQVIDIDMFLTTGDVVLNTEGAVLAAADFLAATGQTGTIEVDGATVTVTVSITVRRTLVPGSPIEVTAVGRATAVTEDTGP